MTVKKLKEALEKYPDNMDVFMAPRKTDFFYGLLNSVTDDEVLFVEDANNTEAKEEWELEEPSKVKCVILDEE